MVDAASFSKQETPHAESSAATARSAFSARILPADGAALEAYSAFCADTVHSPTQSPLWTAAWLEDTGEDGLIALLQQNGRPAMALALEIQRKGPFRMARFAGGSHANGNFPALGPAFDAADAGMMALVAAIREARPDIDMLSLERQRKTFEGRANPTLALPHTTSPNIALAADLSGGFDQVLENSGKRKRKKHRAQARKFEAAGGYRRVEARSVEEVDALLDRFFTLKRARFAEMGIADVFAAPEVRARWRTLFLAALGQAVPPFVLHGLEVGGIPRAITGSSRTRDSIICEFNAFARDELVAFSPGEFLFYENIQAACAEGLAVYDLSVGDEPYKRLWCGMETSHADVFAGLTLKGKLLAAGYRALVRLKRAVKNDPAAAKLAQQLRRIARGRSD
ncbi:GNAT family N-acetyltransferase [Chelativorans salis]|uniref:GNAT family N-acetyltransferase n=1 Tax=Chelativorans salis TaxID=2978478 RepID=A0ABT2LMN7_9HYPH|nr:GNAT family N-acetyltransferase [Chelativorans sp. EGI FJ00035]MCT7375832.1 GNAT family N-acetyltransferase [Chelativorans sp. EGI FJ00035]